MFQKIGLPQLRQLFLMGQIIIFFSGIFVLFCAMVLDRREDILHSLMAKLDTATEAMASQLKANQVPSSNINSDYEVFIINQGDGAIVIDRKSQEGSLQKLWESYRTKLIYEMQKEKNGWIVYPGKASWSLSQEQRIIRYISIDELHWILAMESSRPTEFQILQGSFNLSILFSLSCISMIGGGLFWLMTIKYFDLLKQRISDSVENNFMSLSGEESMSNKFQVSSPPQNKDEPIELMPASPTQPQKAFKEPVIEPSVLPVDEREELLLKKPAVSKKPVVFKEPVVKEPDEINELTEKNKTEAASLDKLTLDVNSIKSTVLKKMIKKFREK